MKYILLAIVSASMAFSVRFAGAATEPASRPLQPPVAPIRPHRVTSPQGSRIDNYYWLRDDTRANPEVLEYLKAENAYTDAVLSGTRQVQQDIYGEILSRIKQQDASVPYRKSGFWYYSRFEPGREYPVIARKRGGLTAPEQVMLDANAAAKGRGYFHVGGWQVSPDGRLFAWAEDAVGRRQYRLRVKDLDTGRVLPDSIGNTEPEFAWAADNRTLVYVSKDPVTLLGDKVRKHVLGTAPAHDALVFEQTDKSFYTRVAETKDRAFLTIFSQSTVSTEVRAARANDPALHFAALVPRERDHEYEAEHLDGRWILRTNWHAKNFRIVAADESDVATRSKWRDVIAHREDAFVAGFDVFKTFLAIEERSGGLANIRTLKWGARESSLIGADEPAYSLAFSDNAEIDSTLLRYSYSSLTTPDTIYDLDVETGSRTFLKRDAVLGGFKPEQYATEHVWATARDGTKVPVSLVYKKGYRKDGTAPLLQYGYGAYGDSSDPAFSIEYLSLLDRGFVYAIAHIRGGQEMGRDWYENGKLLKKRNTFNDFIDVTRWLVRERYADPKRTFATGLSAGGLLMGAVNNLAPQDYRGIVALVPFVDVVTTMLDETIPLTSNEFDEWGNPRKKEFHDYMLGYSPYDNVTRQAYPALYVSTALWDSQVQYYEPAKWVAKLRALKTDSNPLVFRVNMEASHGGRSGRFQQYGETAEEYAFMLWQAGMLR